MTWRLAESLHVLFEEANRVAPGRNKAYDGTIGDAAHAARVSRHNPNKAKPVGVVCAGDITHDPAHGMDTYDLFNFLRLHPHPDLEYVISNRRVARRTNGFKVEVYTGENAHDKHTHVAVGRGPDSAPTPPHDDLDGWNLAVWKQEGDMAPMEYFSAAVHTEMLAAQKKLIEAGLLAKERPPDNIATLGYVNMMLERVREEIQAGNLKVG